MRQILLSFVIITNLMEVALPISFKNPLSIVSEALPSFKSRIKNYCKPGKEGKWSKKMTINETKAIEMDKAPAANGSYSYMDTLWGLTSYIPNPLKTTQNAIGNVIRSYFPAPSKKTCSLIPQTLVLPDFNITKVLKFRAFNGKIIGIRKLCYRLASYPVEFSRTGLNVMARYYILLDGLHFQYRVIDKLLGVNHLFNWTLSKGSVGEMAFKAGVGLGCLVSVEDINLRLDFDGTDGKKKCVGDCHTILEKLQCYLYYNMVRAFGLLSGPLKDAVRKYGCITFKDMGR